MTGPGTAFKGSRWDTAEPDLIAFAIDDIKAVLYGPRVNTTNRLDVLLALTRREPASVFWPVFHNMWSSCDDTWHLRRRLLRELTDRHLEARSTDYLPDDARAFLDDLPSPFTAYRGCSKRRVLGVAWTTSEAVAEGFARGHRGIAVPSPRIVTARVPKSAVFSVCLDRKEAEIVIDPRQLISLESRPLKPGRILPSGA